MKEENEEYFEAAQNDIVELADALGDMLYILWGTVITMDFKIKLKKFLMRYKVT